MEEKNLIVALKYNDHSKHFFVDFANESGYIVSLKITEGEATSLSKNLGIKIMIG